jgi:hypothetical protein
MGGDQCRLCGWVAGSNPSNCNECAETHDRDLLTAAFDRLDWLRAEYGPDDLDLLTFGPIVELYDALLRIEAA